MEVSVQYMQKRNLVKLVSAVTAIWVSVEFKNIFGLCLIAPKPPFKLRLILAD